MGFRFRKSYNLGPLRVNLSKSGVGYSVGTKGFRATKKTGGGYRTTASIPGTGISYTKDYGHSAKGASNNRSDGKYAAPNNSNTPAPSGGSSAPPKSKLTEFLLCLFLGCFGAHRFYMRKFGTAVLYLCTIGCFGIGWLVDVVKLAIGIFANGGTKKRKQFLQLVSSAFSCWRPVETVRPKSQIQHRQSQHRLSPRPLRPPHSPQLSRPQCRLKPLPPSRRPLKQRCRRPPPPRQRFPPQRPLSPNRKQNRSQRNRKKKWSGSQPAAEQSTTAVLLAVTWITRLLFL